MSTITDIETASGSARLGHLSQAALAWTTLAVVLLAALPLGANRPVSWTILSVGVLVLFALQLMIDLRSDLPRSVRALWPAALAYLGVLLWAIVQMRTGVGPGLAHPVWSLVPEAPAAISAEPIAGQAPVMRLATYAMIFWLALRAAQRPERALAMLGAVAVFTALLSGFGIWAQLAGKNPILGDLATDRLSASFVNRNSFATYAVFGAIANLALYLHVAASGDGAAEGADRRLRNALERFFAGGWVFALGFLLTAGALILSQSRGGAAAGLVAVATFVLLRRRRDGPATPAAFALPALVVGFVLLTLSTGLTDRLLATGEEDGRFTVYPRILAGIADRPLLGHGLGAFQDAFRPYVPIEVANVEWNLGHDSYLENVFELGLPGAALFYAGLGWIARGIFRGALTRRRHRIFATTAAACLAGGAFHALFDFSLQIPAVTALFALLLGMGWAQGFRRESRGGRP